MGEVSSCIKTRQRAIKVGPCSRKGKFASTDTEGARQLT